MAQIHELLPLAAADVGAIGKDSKNVQQNYSYRGIDAVLNAVHEVFCKHKIVAVPTVIDSKREERPTKTGGTLIYTILTVRYDFFAPDGSSIPAVVIGEGMDSGDKSSNKAMSAAYKYAVGQMLSIPFAAVDSETDNPEPAPKKPAPPAKPTPAPASPPPATPATATERLALENMWAVCWADYCAEANVPPSEVENSRHAFEEQFITYQLKDINTTTLTKLLYPSPPIRDQRVKWLVDWWTFKTKPRNEEGK